MPFSEMAPASTSATPHRPNSLPGLQAGGYRVDRIAAFPYGDAVRPAETKPELSRFWRKFVSGVNVVHRSARTDSSLQKRYRTPGSSRATYAASNAQRALPNATSYSGRIDCGHDVPVAIAVARRVQRDSASLTLAADYGKVVSLFQVIAKTRARRGRFRGGLRGAYLSVSTAFGNLTPCSRTTRILSQAVLDTVVHRHVTEQSREFGRTVVPHRPTWQTNNPRACGK